MPRIATLKATMKHEPTTSKNTNPNSKQHSAGKQQKSRKNNKKQPNSRTNRTKVGVLDVTRLLFNDGIQLNGLPAPRADSS